MADHNLIKSILFVRNKSDVNLQAIISNLDIKLFNISILDLKNGELILYNSQQVIKIAKSSERRFINYIKRYFTALLYVLHFSKNYYDVIHVMNIKRENFWVFPFFRKQTSKLLVSVYGRSTYLYWTKRILFSQFFKYADYVIFTNPALRDEFATWYNNVNYNKLIVAYLPMANVRSNPIKIEHNKIIEFCARYRIRQDLIRISCSSTIASYDQHDKVIDELAKLKNKENVQLMFLLTYGGSEMEKQRIICRITEKLANFNYAIIDKFLTNEELAIYRSLTDIYINMRTSDQMAGAVIESIYEGSLLISASWLNYQMLDDFGIYYVKTSSFNELSSCIDENIMNLHDFKINHALVNKQKLINECSLEVTMNKWNNVYQV